MRNYQVQVTEHDDNSRYIEYLQEGLVAPGWEGPFDSKAIREWYTKSGFRQSGARKTSISEGQEDLVVHLERHAREYEPGELEVQRQEWLSSRDERVRDSHSERDGQVVEVGQPFDIGAGYLLFPGDPEGPAEEVVNCRCTTIPVL